MAGYLPRRLRLQASRKPPLKNRTCRESGTDCRGTCICRTPCTRPTPAEARRDIVRPVPPQFGKQTVVLDNKRVHALEIKLILKLPDSLDYYAALVARNLSAHSSSDPQAGGHVQFFAKEWHLSAEHISRTSGRSLIVPQSSFAAAEKPALTAICMTPSRSTMTLIPSYN